MPRWFFCCAGTPTPSNGANDRVVIRRDWPNDAAPNRAGSRGGQGGGDSCLRRGQSRPWSRSYQPPPHHPGCWCQPSPAHQYGRAAPGRIGRGIDYKHPPPEFFHTHRCCGARLLNMWEPRLRRRRKHYARDIARLHPLRLAPVFLATSATILPAAASISASVKVFPRGCKVTDMATDFLPSGMPLPS